MIKKTRTSLEPQDVKRLFESAPQPRGFMINANGTFQFKTVAKEDDDDGERSNDQPNAKRSLIRVCSPFKVIRKVEHLDSEGLIERVSADCALIDSSGRYVFLTVDADKFLSIDLLKDLTSKGLRVFNGQSPLALMRSIYNELEPEVPTVRAVTRQGVQKSGSIVIDGLVIGDEDNLVIDPCMKRGFSVRGTHAEWIMAVSLPALASNAAVFSISHAFAGLLKYAADLPDAVFNLYGPSSSGKTKALYASASVLGHWKTLVETWLGTGPGFELAATRAQGWSWFIDEARIGLADKTDDHMIFALMNGRTKSRAIGHGGIGANLSIWGLSTQEEREEDAYKGRPRNGVDVRLFSLPTGYDLERGAFEKARDADDAKAMADRIQDGCDQYFGAPIIEFSVRLQERPDWTIEVRDRVREAGQKIIAGRSLSGLHRRGLDSFAPIAAAGEWATELGVTGWGPGDATRAVKAMFDAWLVGPPRDYWRKKRERDARLGNPGVATTTPFSTDDIASMIAKRAAEANAHDDAAANDALNFLRQETPVALGALRLEGRSPHPEDRNCPVFIHTPGNATLLFVAPERLRCVLDGREEKAVKKLRERRVLVANGQPSSLRYTLKVDGEHRNFYAFDYTAVVGVGALQP